MQAEQPGLELRTALRDLADASALPDDIPNLKSHTARFYMKLFGAWMTMGF